MGESGRVKQDSAWTFTFYETPVAEPGSDLTLADKTSFCSLDFGLEPSLPRIGTQSLLKVLYEFGWFLFFKLFWFSLTDFPYLFCLCIFPLAEEIGNAAVSSERHCLALILRVFQGQEAKKLKILEGRLQDKTNPTFFSSILPMNMIGFKIILVELLTPWKTGGLQNNKLSIRYPGLIEALNKS